MEKDAFFHHRVSFFFSSTPFLKSLFHSSLSTLTQMYSKNNNGGHLLSSFLLRRTSLLLVSLVLTSTFLCVCGDDTQALRNTLSSLCSINSGGEFGSCCKTHDAGSVNIKDKNTWDCFARDIESSDDLNVISLFVLFSFPINIFTLFYSGISPPLD